MEKQMLLNTYFSNVTMEEAVTEIERLAQERKKSYVVAVNVDVTMKIERDEYLKKITDEADVVLADGKPLVWISKIYGHGLKARVTGSDLVPVLCARAAQKGQRIFILGGKEGVAEAAKKCLEEAYPNLQVSGTYAPPFGFEKDEKELEKINHLISRAHPDYLIVCFGCPKQEKFIYENYQKYDATVSICGGATVDFLSGNKKRAPEWMGECGLEWLYRFFQEPRRLFKRYFIDDIKILGLVWKYRNQKRRTNE